MKSMEANDMTGANDPDTTDASNTTDKNMQQNTGFGYRELLVTKDGSHTVLVPSLDITYRSRHGAIQESMHVFIDAGLKYKWSDALAAGSDEVELDLFELGFGTGLNALLSCQEALKAQRKIRYTAIEPVPIETEIVQQLNYPDPGNYLSKLHGSEWNIWIDVHPYFQFIKYKTTLAGFEANGLTAGAGSNDPAAGSEPKDSAAAFEPNDFAPGSEPKGLAGGYEPNNPAAAFALNKPVPHTGVQSLSAPPATFDLVYFDAFGPLTQPDLWSAETFAKVASLMRPGAVLTTYCSKSVVRKTMMSVGLRVTKVPGPYGKREMVRAFK